jgi:Protein of unknown function (DUF5672)
MRPQLVFHHPDVEVPGPFAPALELLNAGKMEAGYGLLVELNERYPNDPRSAHFLGMFLYNIGRTGEAARFFSKAASAAGTISAYSYNQGAALLMTDRPKEAAAAFHKSLHGDRVIPAAHCWTWLALDQVSKLRPTVSRLRAALEDDPAQRNFEAPPRRISVESTTLCAIDCLSPGLAVRSLRKSMAQCRFDSVKLLTSLPGRHEGIEVVAIDPINSIEDYSLFVRKSLARYIDTPFALVTQWDGYVTHGDSWSQEFLAYDYIGARWPTEVMKKTGGQPQYNVGNGGFSLRSQRFLRAGSDPKLTLIHPEDVHMCRTYRRLLEVEHEMQFAEAGIADRFAFEMEAPPGVPFGFHGCVNLCCFEPDPKWMRFDFLGPEAFG